MRKVLGVILSVVVTAAGSTVVVGLGLMTMIVFFVVSGVEVGKVVVCRVKQSIGSVMLVVLCLALYSCESIYYQSANSTPSGTRRQERYIRRARKENPEKRFYVTDYPFGAVRVGRKQKKKSYLGFAKHD